MNTGSYGEILSRFREVGAERSEVLNSKTAAKHASKFPKTYDFIIIKFIAREKSAKLMPTKG